MSVPLSAVAREPSPLLVSRQPVLDARDRVVGYRIAYSLLNDGEPIEPTAVETIGIVEEVLAVIDPQEHVAGNMAHLPLTREMLAREELPPLDPEQVLLRVRYEDALNPGCAKVIAEAVSRGYRLELDGLPGRGFNLDLLHHFEVVELDLGSWTLEDAAVVLPHIGYRRTLALATGVATHEQREAARAAGFDWFAGPFFCTPNVLGGEPLDVGDLHTIAELCRMQTGEVELEELVSLIERDLGLGVRLLRYMNSAFLGLSGRVSSIAQAATMLGTRGLSRWALMAAAVGDSSPVSRELALIGLTRARACELIGMEADRSLDPDELFTIGLLSTADAVFRMPMARVVAELPLAPVVTDALLRGAGPQGDILRSVIAYEQGEFLAPSVRSTLLENSAAYRSALLWARQAVLGMS